MNPMNKDKKAIKTLAQNRKAHHDYFVLDKYEAGIELFGTEVKSLRLGQANLKDSYCTTDGRQIWVNGLHISPYEKGNIFNKDPLRQRRLLMHKREILKLFEAVKLDGQTLVPLSLYLKGPVIKIEIGLCKGKKNYDKRDAAAKADSERRIRREFAKEQD